MEGNIVFNFSNRIIENIILSAGIFISIISFLSYVVTCNLKVKRMLYCLIFIVMFGVVFGSIGHYLFYYNDICKLEEYSPYYFKIYNLTFFRDNTIGFSNDEWMSDHGLILGIIFGCLFSSFMFKFNFYRLLDSTILPICILLSTFRILDLFRIRNFGIPTEASYGIIFPKVDYVPRHACMIYESTIILIIFFILLYAFKKTNFNINNSIPNGFLFFIGTLLIYSSKVFIGTLKVQDNLMSNQVLDFLKLGVDQFLSISFLIMSLIFVIYRFPKTKN